MSGPGAGAGVGPGEGAGVGAGAEAGAGAGAGVEPGAGAGAGAKGGAGADAGAAAVVVMGVSGSGKSLVGAALAAATGRPFVDADDLHPLTNVEKMRAGIALVDADRWPWLDAVGAAILAHPDGVVVACSSLRRAYRDRIRATATSAFFIELDGSPELLLERISARVGHFMPPALLESQLALLEPLALDEPGARISIDGTPDEVVARAVAALPAL